MYLKNVWFRSNNAHRFAIPVALDFHPSHTFVRPYLAEWPDVSVADVCIVAEVKLAICPAQ